MAQISYSAGGKFDEAANQSITLTNYAGNTKNYSIIVYSPSEFVQLTNFTDDTAANFSFPGSFTSLKIDFSDNASRVGMLGGDWGDILYGGLVRDGLDGGGGDDTIIGGGGNDQLFGSSGVDTLSYETSAGGVLADLSAGAGLYADAEGDTFNGFENLRGSLFNDTLVGDDAANLIEGWGGQDEIRALGGDDRIVLTSAGAVDGGAGYDILTLDASGGSLTFGSPAIVAVEQVNVRDRMTVDFSAVTDAPDLFRAFSAAGGWVDLTTTGSGETIRLGLGDDTLDAGGGDDRIFVYGGGATIDGGDGTDRLFIQSGGYTFDDAALTGVESVVLRGDASLDLGAMTTGMTVISTSADGTTVAIGGTAGDDVIRLGEGGDTVRGGAGDDRLFGGAGADAFVYVGADFGRDRVVADLSNDAFVFFGVVSSVDDINVRAAKNGVDVVVTFDGLDKSDSLLLRNVSVEQVEAARDSLFIVF